MSSQDKKDAIAGVTATGQAFNGAVKVPDFTLTRSDTAAETKAIKDKLIEALRGELTNWIGKHYKASTVTGTSPVVAKALTALRNGTVSHAQEQIFNTLFIVMKDNGGKWEKCSISDIDTSKLGDYRINALTSDYNIDATTVKKLPTVVNYLPVLNAGNRVLYNEGTLAPTSDSLLLRKIFWAAFTNDPSLNTILPGFKDSSSVALQPDLKALFADVLLNNSAPSAHIADNETEKIDAALKGKWQRIGENSWVHTLANGTRVTIRPGTPEFDADVSREVSNCAAVGFSKDAAKCASFLTSVAMNDQKELAKLAVSMTEDVAAATVAELHPKFALAILKSFGFRRKMCKDKIAGRQLEKVQRVQEWLDKFVDKTFEDTTVSAIKANQKLQNFLDLLAQLVNSNPSILNDGLVVDTEESKGEVSVPSELAARKIAAARPRGNGKPVIGWNDIQSNMNKVYGSFSRGLTFDGMTTNSPFGMENLFPQMSLLTSAPVVRGSTWGSMGGGGGENKIFLQEHDTGLEYSRNIQRIIAELLENLRSSSNKHLSDSELESIKDKLVRFEELEQELFSTAWNIQKYSQLLKVTEAENRRETITEDDVKRYVEKYGHLLNRYEKTGNSFNTLISLLKDCCDGDGEKSANCKTL
jgi:hypothetical protein